MKQFWSQIADILERDKAISKQTANTLKKDFVGRSKPEICDFLLTAGLVSKKDLLQALSKYYQVPPFDVEGYFFSHLLLRQFPKDFLLRNVIIPVEVLAGDNIVTMVAGDPSDTSLLPKIGEYVSYVVQFFVGIDRDITDAVKSYYEEPLTVTDADQYIAEEEEEKKALEIEKRKLDSEE